MTLGPGTLHINGTQVGIGTDFHISAPDSRESSLAAKPLPVVVTSGCAMSWTWACHDDMESFLDQVFTYSFQVKQRRKVGPRRLRTVWVRPSRASDIDSCLKRGEA